LIDATLEKKAASFRYLIFSKLRNKKKISQLELAEALELSQSSVAKYEKANAQIKFNTLLLLCDFFEVDPKELLVDGDPFYPPPNLKKQQLGDKTKRGNKQLI
ncbi:MAG: helix-turn-helix transcriptional regulator, partial [Bacteroidetes bacterium]|nr:helix-turn-helix transcriptional regulator [Bacteroidota bacterium]